MKVIYQEVPEELVHAVDSNEDVIGIEALIAQPLSIRHVVKLDDTNLTRGLHSLDSGVGDPIEVLHGAFMHQEGCRAGSQHGLGLLTCHNLHVRAVVDIRGARWTCGYGHRDRKTPRQLVKQPLQKREAVHRSMSDGIKRMGVCRLEN